MKLSTTLTHLGLALASVKLAQAAEIVEFGQCGGINWTGGTVCITGTKCTVLSSNFHICLQLPIGGPKGCPTPSTIPNYNNAKLPNPFQFDDGSAVRSKADWECRRSQIAALIQGYEAGDLPSRPQHLVATFTQTNVTGTLNVTAGIGSNFISFASTITYPTGKPPRGGWPLVIGYDGGSIPVPAGIATLHYNNGQIAVQNDATSRGQGLFYNLYGANATASSMTAWVWGVSRIIDTLESLPNANINTQKIAVTGCSRDGKGALMAGAFEPRIALTIPQESGSGGDVCWRISKYEQDQGSVVQTATEIVQENVWFSSNFANYVNTLDVLPYDHHLLMALVAPRPLVSYENTDFVWLSPMSAWGCVNAAHTVYQALGVPQNHGFEQIGGHQHCAWPANLTQSLNAYFDKFILDKNDNTNGYFSTNDVFNGTTWNPSQWIGWATPTLH